MNGIRIWFLLLLLAAAGTVAADAPRPAARRFLLIVEASAATEKSSVAIENAVRDLVGNAFAGKLSPGDTLGVWVYGAALDDRFPMQVWQADASPAVADAVVAHLKARPWKEAPIWENVLGPLQRIIRSSDDLTIALVSAPGSRPSTRTELDAKFHAIYSATEEDLLRNKLPFVTFWAVRAGEWVDTAVNSGLGPWTIPDPPVKARAMVQAKPAAPASRVGAPRRQPSLLEMEPPPSSSASADHVLAAVKSQKEMDAALAAGTVKPIEFIPPPPKPAPAPRPEEAVAASVAPSGEAPTPPSPAAPAMANVPAVLAPSPTAPQPSAATTPAVVAAQVTPAVEPASPKPALAVVAAAAPPSVQAGSGVGYLLGGVGLLLAAGIGLGWWLGRRRTAPIQGSLITQSFDRG